MNRLTTYTTEKIIQRAKKHNYTVLTIFKKNEYPGKSMISVRHSCGAKFPLKVNTFMKHECSCRKPGRVTKVCLLCEKPHFLKVELCGSCHKRKLGLGLSTNRLFFIKKHYKTNDVFSLIAENPSVRDDTSFRSKTTNLSKKTAKNHYRSDSYRLVHYEKWGDVIPIYIQELFSGLPAFQFLTLSGEKLNPKVHFVCKACNVEQCQTYKDLLRNKSHQCTSSLSSGEAVVVSFLTPLVDIRTQFETLKCINPITKKQLPYDIEIVGRKLLIEIQGPQHFDFIEWFHGTIDNFEYQRYRDQVKKDYAERKGYRMLYLTYEHFKDLSYQQMILSELG